jgi:hypothetical protein
MQEKPIFKDAKIRWVDFLIALICGLVFAVSFNFNQYFDAYFVYAPGISLLFVPAGVKLLLLLIGRWPAYIGLLISGTYLGAGIWPDKTLYAVFLFAFVGLTNYAIVAMGFMKLLRINASLDNLKYSHIVLFSLAASLLNGVVHNLIYIMHDVIITDELWTKSMAMTFGDFMGCFVTVGIFHTVLLMVKSIQAKQALLK